MPGIIQELLKHFTTSFSAMPDKKPKKNILKRKRPNLFRNLGSVIDKVAVYVVVILTILIFGGYILVGGTLPTKITKLNTTLVDLVISPTGPGNGNLQFYTFSGVTNTPYPTLASGGADPDQNPADLGAPGEATSPAGRAPCQSADKTISTPTKTAPIVSVKSFGAKGDGVTDDAAAIQTAMDSMSGGGTLEFPAGTYKYSDILRLTKPNVTLWGYGATLIPTNQTAAGIQLAADNTNIYGFTRSAPRSWPRFCGGTPDISRCYGIYIFNSNNHVIMDNTMNHGDGILLNGVANALIARNTINKSTADAIYLTGGTHDVRVLLNTVRENGDDMVALVDYGTPGAEPAIYNILIEHNDLSGNYWGRGITVAGGKNVTIRNNNVSKTAHNAGIYLTEESAWPTTNIRNVLVDNNTVEDVQMAPPAYCPPNSQDCQAGWSQTGQAGIDLYVQDPAASISDVLISNNKVNLAAFNGVRMHGNVSNVSVINTIMTSIANGALSIEPPNIYCSGNKDDGADVSDPRLHSFFPIPCNRFLSGWVLLPWVVLIAPAPIPKTFVSRPVNGAASRILRRRFLLGSTSIITKQVAKYATCI